ncbi:hypothetical protein COV15_00430 [Candidatus Woesearchaeota archaeon CG10_big_fil_rev_8_21_14_0_10_34_12]|nr:MAG: hypothetical protein COV15_00430 [Candidatus Woesearchaeota archaeon CG10_big_fil_rev_8_21_14_0_10_34_12]
MANNAKPRAITFRIRGNWLGLTRLIKSLDCNLLSDGNIVPKKQDASWLVEVARSRPIYTAIPEGSSDLGSATSYILKPYSDGGVAYPGFEERQIAFSKEVRAIEKKKLVVDNGVS